MNIKFDIRIAGYVNQYGSYTGNYYYDENGLIYYEIVDNGKNVYINLI